MTLLLLEQQHKSFRVQHHHAALPNLREEKLVLCSNLFLNKEEGACKVLKRKGGWNNFFSALCILHALYLHALYQNIAPNFLHSFF